MRVTIGRPFFAALLILPAIGHAAPPVPSPASAYRLLLDCRAITDPAARLACYDSKIAAFESAEKSGDVVVADRAQLRETSKGFFGFGALRLPIVGSRTRLETPEQIEAKIVGVRSIGYGKWEIVLDNGMRWRETEPGTVDPRVGRPVVIRSGALNSFFIRIDGAKGVRGLRVE
ncbi:hypothetical protein [Sphingomonas solaris]|uniref:Uncharacterized protein n=1 Tax=Alterirhizorhabdus solaris TaxID=2529389 RepID=A0A558R569_9SPHN|nr:hypothetical protein [Sphingomonas solaris]TVV74497.1 hypothetical protein FOY91_09530 [Sphingomonas solaris]